MHPGIRIDKIPVSATMGLIFTVGALGVFLFELPEAGWFPATSLPLGIAVAIILRLTSRD